MNLFLALCLATVGAVTQKWVEYTLGGETILVDMSALAYNKPLLEHLRNGMPLRRPEDTDEDVEEGDAEGDVPLVTVNPFAQAAFEGPQETQVPDTQVPDTQVPDTFSQQFDFIKHDDGNLHIDVVPATVGWDGSVAHLNNDGSLYYSMQNPDVSHVSQRIHNIVSSLHQSNAGGAKMNDRAPLDAIPILPARPGDVPPDLSESGFAGVSVMHKVPKDPEPYDESTTNTGNFNAYLERDPTETPFPLPSKWAEVERRVPQEDSFAPAATGLQLGSAQAAPLAPTDLLRSDHDSPVDQELVERTGDHNEFKDDLGVRETTLAPEVRQEADQDDTEPGTDAPPSADTRDKDSNNEHQVSDAQIEVIDVLVTQTPLQDEEVTELIQDRVVEVTPGDEEIISIESLVTTEHPVEESTVNTSRIVDEILAQKEEELMLREQQEKQQKLAEKQDQFALDQAMASIFADLLPNEEETMSESDKNGNEEDPVFAMTTESDIVTQANQDDYFETKTDSPIEVGADEQTPQSDIQESQSHDRVDDQLPSNQENQESISPQEENTEDTQGTLEFLPTPQTTPVVPIPYADSTQILSNFPLTREEPSQPSPSAPIPSSSSASSSDDSLHYSSGSNFNPEPITLEQAAGVYMNGQRHNLPRPESDGLIDWYDRDPITIFDPHHHVGVTRTPGDTGVPEDNTIPDGGGTIPGQQRPAFLGDDVNGTFPLPEAEDVNITTITFKGAVYHSADPAVLNKATCRCGLRLNTKIVGGEETSITNFPWQIGLANKADSFVFCGGSLISDQYVLTAAHCVISSYAEDLIVRLGDSYRFGPATVIDVEKIHVHRRYDYNSVVKYDIAILKLVRPVTFTENILPVCLPTDKNKFSNKDAIVTGWGKDSSAGSVQDVLHEVGVKVLSTRKCRKKSYYEDSEVHSSIICAASRNKDACQGDSGGPLVVLNSDYYTLIGVVSWGIGCAEQDYPGIYTRVSSYMKWIRSVTSDAISCRMPNAKPNKIKKKKDKKKNKRKNKRKNKNKRKGDKAPAVGEDEDEEEEKEKNKRRNKPSFVSQILKLDGEKRGDKNKKKNENKGGGGGEGELWQTLSQAIQGISEMIRSEGETASPEPATES